MIKLERERERYVNYMKREERTKNGLYNSDDEED